MTHDVFKSTSFRVRTPDGTMNIIIMEGTDGQPFEVQPFIGKAGSSLAAWAAATCAMVSVALRNKIPLQTIINELADITSDGTARIGASGVCRSGPEGVYSALIQYRNDVREREFGAESASEQASPERVVLRGDAAVRTIPFSGEAASDR
jgi:hypothetical protein